jgi:hypothetical protein
VTQEELGLLPMRWRQLAVMRLSMSRVPVYLTLVDARDGYELYALSGVFRRNGIAYFLRYRCPSTGKVYTSGIPPVIGWRRSVRKALAWKFSLKNVTTQTLFTAES